MKIYKQIKEALNNLLLTKLRTLLAVLGILVGTGSVVAMVMSGQIAMQQALTQFSKLGTNLLSVLIIDTNMSENSSKENQINIQDIDKLKIKLSSASKIAPYTDTYTNISYMDKKINGAIIGGTDTLKKILKVFMQKGRFISFLDYNEKYCVIGSEIAKQLETICRLSPIGQQILIGNVYFTIIGIIKPRPENQFFNQDINNTIIAPLETISSITRKSGINNIVIQLKNEADIKKVENIIRNYVNANFDNKHLFFRSAEQIIKSMKKEKQILMLLLGLIGGISLIVGGIGVMNIMLVSVTERKREIGIRRALGAKQRDIQIMFLLEAMVLSLLGGTSGIVIGIVVTYMIAIFVQWAFQLYLLAPMVGFLVSVMTGIFFGYYPAYKAAKLNPITALKTE